LLFRRVRVPVGPGILPTACPPQGIMPTRKFGRNGGGAGAAAELRYDRAPSKSRRKPPGVHVMIFSRDRILTTHVGSLPRNETLSDLLVSQENGENLDAKILADEMDKAVRHVVEQR
jgi:hypothetical protein